MKITKKQEKEIMQVYTTYWKSYLKGDMKTMASLLENDFKVIGSTEAEVFYNKKEAMKFYTATAEQIAGTAALRNRDIKIDLVDGLVLITEKMDFYVLMEGEWTFYAKGRLSSFLQKKGKGWKFVQQHGSMPDTRAQEGEQVALDKISKENLELRDAVKRRTVELENKNRELEIEAALEKVRTVAMGMKEPADMPEVCKTISLQLQSLGVKEIRNVQTAVFYESRGTYMNYEYYAKHKKTIITETVYTNHTVAKAFAKKMLHGKGEIFVTHIKGKKVKDWMAYQKTTNVFIDRFLEKASSLNYYWHSLGSVALGISTYTPLSKEDLNLFKHFLNVFELAYTRYLDIEQAIAQAKEAKIEAALERVRSRSLAMHKSDELQDVVNTVFERLKELEMNMNVASIFIFKEGSKDWQQWVATSTTNYSSYFHIPYTDLPVFRDLEEAKQSGDDFYAVCYPFKQKNEWFNYAFNNTEYSRIPGDRKKFIIESEFFLVSFALSQNTGIQIAKYEGKEFSATENDVLKRFSKVFEQAYTRFLDLQKAEAQAREAQIEVALERARTQSMIMQHSNELDDTLRVFHEQVLLLGIKSAFSFLWLPDEKNDRHIFWAAWREGKNGSIIFKSKAINYPLDRNEPATAQCLIDWKGNESIVSYHVPPPGVENYFAAWQELIDGVEQLKPEYFSGGLYYVEAFMKYGCFGVLVAADLREDEKKILGRFAIEFERTYTRFLDLQKAEAQAKEAKIEAALEKVRSSSLAMHHSEELKEVITILFDKFRELDFETGGGAAIIIFKEDSKDIVAWVANPDYISASCFAMPYFDHPIVNNYWKARENGTYFSAHTYSFEEKNSYWNYLYEHTDLKNLPADNKKMIAESKSLTNAFAMAKNSGILIGNYTGKMFSGEENEILKRFAKVFEQAYIRFLDLQKSEAQSREAQVQLAMERVRARTMAMQHSEELLEAASLLFKQLADLGTRQWSSGFDIWNANDVSAVAWMSNPDGSMGKPFSVPYTDDIFFKQIYEAKQSGTDFFVMESGGKELEETYKYLFNLPEAKPHFDGIKSLGFQMPAFQITHCAFFSQGYLMFITFEAAPEMWDIFKRFAKVFEQTYTRFLDLQKAEAQSRESQVQLAMERVRARTMAMQRSDELVEAASLLFKQVQSFGVSAFTCGFNIWQADYISVTSWMANPDGSLGWTPLRLPHTEHTHFMQSFEARKRGEDFFVLESGGKELEDTYRYMFSIPEWKDRFGDFEDSGFPVPAFQISHYVFFAQGYLLFITYEPVPGMWDIFKRFGKVFEQTYTRFLDLQKAETQAREAQIELGLERVRARAMAMQKSNELSELVDTVFKELTKLDFALNWCIINIIDESSLSNTVWAANPDIEKTPESYHMKFEDYPFHDAMMKGYKESATKYIYVLEGLEKKVYDEYLFKETEFSKVPEEAQAASRAMEKYVVSFSFSNFGGLQTVGTEPLSGANMDILARFGKVFDLTYTRFNDLQKAEAQAREAQIETALEKVRSRSMGMQKSDELSEVSHVINGQLQQLDFKNFIAGFYMNYRDSDDFHICRSDASGSLLEKTVVPYFDHPAFNRFKQAKEQGLDFYTVSLTFEEKNQWVNHSLQYFREAPQEVKEFLYNSAGYSTSCALLKHVGLFVTNFEGIPFSDEENVILMRFAKVFEQTYTRFLDLQKAEAQAREAQIETALEKVRSRSMGMQKSEELKEVIQVVYEQFVHLNIKIEHTGFVIDYKARDDYNIWIADPLGVPSQIIVPYFDSVYYNRFNEAKERGEDFFATNLSFEEKNRFYEKLFEYVPGLTEEAREFYFNCPGLAASTVLLDNVCLYIENFSAIPYTDEENNTLMRFGKVFQQTYTRFLDLQKAETQAREALIEAALEKVRSRSLAVHKSDEFKEVINVVFEKLQDLKISLNAVGISVFIEGSRNVDAYVCGPNEEGVLVTKNFRLPYFDNLIANDLVNAHENGLDFFSKTYAFEEKNIYWQYQLNNSDLKHLPADIKHLILQSYSYTVSIALAKHSTITINDFEGKLLSEKEKDIIKRFNKVFEQAYIRFLDLQKAEAQARAAQIEAALERVRSKTMAMHNSQDVGDTVATMFDELVRLGIETNRCGILIYGDTIHAEVWTAKSNKNEKATLITGQLDLSIHPLLQGIFDAWKNKESFYTYPMLGDDLKRYYQAINDSQYYPTLFNMDTLPEKEFHSDFFFTEGSIFAFTAEPIAAEATIIFKRFAGVFGQTYRRYLDLQKAEAQSKESQVQLAMERVRARTMAMQQSNELPDAANILFQQVQSLGMPAWSAGYCIWDDDKKAITLWMSSAGIIQQPFRAPVTEDPSFIHFFDAYQRGETFYVEETGGDELVSHYKYMCKLPVVGDMLNKFVEAGGSLPVFQIFHLAFFSQGFLLFITYEQVPAAHDIFKRFGKVFEQTYTRFLDLKKAEAQAREAQIEAAMEKVRARSLAMQKPEELIEVAELLRKEMGSLGVEELETSSIYIVDETTGITECWYAIKDIRGENTKLVSDHMSINLPDTWVGREMLKFFTSAEKQASILMQGESRKEWINYCTAKSKGLAGYYDGEIPDRTYHLLKFSYGYMGAASPGDISAESWDLLQRATAVFSFAYTRFLDLQKADAQTREAQIELALERVRARTMAMFKSEELAETAAVLFHQLIGLGIVPNRLFIGIIKDESGDVEAWATDETGIKVNRQFVLSSNKNNAVKKMYDGWKSKEKSIVIDMHGKELENYFHYLNDEMHVPFTIGLDQKRRVQHIAYFSKGFIGMAAPDEQPPSTINLLERFSGVFSLTYTRFLDLQKAEAQAKEATIEAALEKVRGKAMAMHNSNDFSSAASMVFTELRKLGINPIRCGVGLLNKESRKAQLYSATSGEQGDSLSLVGWIMLSNHPVAERIYDTWLKNEDYYPELGGEQLKSYYENLLAGLSLPSVPDWQGGQIQYGTFLPYSVGCLYAWSEAPYNEAEIKILKRFATIIDLTFRRYIELQQSEANAREAVKQAALDRVRADIASMRTTNDLEKITPLIWNELKIIGIPFIRCGVFIMDEHLEQIHTFLSTPDGNAIAAFHIPYSTPGNIQEVLTHWQQEDNYIAHWNELSFKEFADTLVKQGALASSAEYLQTIPQGGFYLHFLPFLQGMLYVGNSAQLKTEEIALIQSVAEAFSTAYARYEDFNKLEAAKQTVEKTLVDLKQAQTQLVQSEKMASLGELTAGIAHEIQNPLNFVNNFSEVSNELIDEMMEEVAKGNYDEVKAIADDVKQNLEKINHHGKRADGIVKGMLQHSRSSGLVKEPTDINKLADEYLRLAYHGLRAKDKSFNATLKTEYDKNIGNINIIPQDIGRVILNLITNAFYAVMEKKKQQPDYEPIVTVSTVGTVSLAEGRGEVQVKVKDNGSGIPQKILDKIFQPFFTTKPTGLGTGLGLSLAYDIVKAHGGEIKVTTKENEGTEFSISLPV